jgi:acetyl-CoA carboxylase biotin carboxyl carrier protein
VLTFEEIKELIKLVADNGLEGLVIERSGFKVRIEGRTPEPRVTVSAPDHAAGSIAPSPLPSSAAAPSAEVAVEPKGELAAASRSDSAEVMKSPIVGTFYAAPNPDSPPYVRVGDRVEVGQVLCIVEAMKLMNEIESDVAGVVVEILPKNAQPVEFGEPLFAIQAG